MGGDLVETPDNTSRLLGQHLELHVRDLAWNFGTKFLNGICIVGPMALDSWWQAE